MTESESEALAAVSQANRTLTQARQAVKDARATRRPLPKRSTPASARESERRRFPCRGPHLPRDCPDRNKLTSKGSKGPKDNVKSKRSSGRGKGLGVVTMAKAFAVSAAPETELVSSVAKKRGFNGSCDDYNPFDAYSQSEQLCSRTASLSDWNQWRRHLIEIHLSVHGIILKCLLKRVINLPSWTLRYLKLRTVTMNDVR